MQELHIEDVRAKTREAERLACQALADADEGLVWLKRAEQSSLDISKDQKIAEEQGESFKNLAENVSTAYHSAVIP